MGDITYKRFENESDDELIYRICSDKDLIGTWPEVTAIINGITGKDYGESTYRKKFQAFTRMLNANRSKFSETDSQIEELDLKIQALAEERQKLNTTKVEYSRSVRQKSRFDLYYENVGSKLEKYPTPSFEPFQIERNEECHVLTIADIHAGSFFETETNSYSYEECTARFELLLSNMIDYVSKNQLNKIKVISLGDNIQGILRLTDLQLNESTVVEATVFVSKALASFLNQLSTYCMVDYYHCPTSNHTQIRPLGTKSSELAGEDVEFIIGNYIKDVLQNNERVVINTNFGKEYIEIDILGFDAIAMHGHQRQIKNLENVLKNISYQKRKFYDFAFLAHFHGSKEFNVGEGCTNDLEVFICPSFIGTCPYAESIGKGSKGACKIYRFDEIYGYTGSKKIVLN